LFQTSTINARQTDAVYFLLRDLLIRKPRRSMLRRRKMLSSGLENRPPQHPQIEKTRREKSRYVFVSPNAA